MDRPSSSIVPEGSRPGAYPASLLFFVSFLTLLLNLTGLTWGLPARWHPDEKADVVLKMARERSLAPESFINPSLPLYAMLPAIGLQDTLAQRGLLWGPAADPLVAGRALSALAGAAAVLWLGLLAQRHAPAAGVLPPLLLGLLPAVVNLCHFATSEAWLLLGTVATLGLCLDHAEGRASVLSLGVAVGLTASTKYTAAALLAPALAAVWLRPLLAPEGEGTGRTWRRDLACLGGTGALLLLAGMLLAGSPGAALGGHLHLKDARLLHPENALAFVRGAGRAMGAAGVLLLALAAFVVRGAAKRRRFARAEVVTLALAAGAGFLLGTPYAALRPLAFLSDLAYNAQTRVEYKGLTGEATSFLAYASLLADAVTLPILAAALAGLLVLGARAVRSHPASARALILGLALVTPFVLVASGGHRAMRFLVPTWPALAWLAGEALGSLRDRLPRRLVTAAVVARAAVAALLVVRLFLVDSRRLAARFLEEHVPPGATIDLIANHAGYAPAPQGRAIRIVPTLSREMAPVARFTEAAERYPGEASEWLVLTASFYERFLDHPDQQPERAAFFRALLEERGGFAVAARFRQTGFWHPPNEFLDPEIVVLRKRDWTERKE